MWRVWQPQLKFVHHHQSAMGTSLSLAVARESPRPINHLLICSSIVTGGDIMSYIITSNTVSHTPTICISPNDIIMCLLGSTRVSHSIITIVVLLLFWPFVYNPLCVQPCQLASISHTTGFFELIIPNQSGPTAFLDSF